MTVADLYAEAVAVSRAAVIHEAQRDIEETVAFIESVTAEQNKLSEEIIAKLESAVIPAAAGGFSSVEILGFKGGDQFEEYSLLFLLLGGHDQERRRQLEAMGFEPLIGRLSEALRPFDLHHVWDRETNWNRLILKWYK